MTSLVSPSAGKPELADRLPPGPADPPPASGTLAFSALAAVAINALAAWLWTLLTRTAWWDACVAAQSVGLSIYGVAELLSWLSGGRPRGMAGHVGVALLAIAGGLALGLGVSGLLLGDTLADGWRQLPHRTSVALLGGLSLTLVAVHRIAHRLRELTALTVAVKEQAHALAQEKTVQAREAQALAAELKWLQAQLEPHFLSNTLANLAALTELDPPRARQMLDDLTLYLRATLKGVHAPHTTVGEEVERIAHYLGLFQPRMGERLHVEIDVKPELRGEMLPPMLLQPLVENALLHGLEPAPHGGTLWIAAASDGRNLTLIVEDTGVGLDRAHATGAGQGLANVRERLAAQCGTRARLDLFDAHPHGVRAVVTLPLQR